MTRREEKGEGEGEEREERRGEVSSSPDGPQAGCRVAEEQSDRKKNRAKK